MSDRRRALEVALISFLGATFIRLLRVLVRVEYHGEAEIRRREREGERFLLAFWHRHLLLMPYAYRGQKVSILISQHRDGELIARTMAYFGHHSSRGSSTRGGASGMRELLRRFKDGYDLAITPDGPKGPAQVAKAGAAQLAALAGVPIIPVAMGASRAKLLASWDRFVIPKPFARVCFVYGEPLLVDRHEDTEGAAGRLTAALNEAEERAEELAGAPKETRCAA